jgi:hypothetical protein
MIIVFAYNSHNYDGPELNSKQARQNLARCRGWLQYKFSLDFTHGTCMWKRMSREDTIDNVATNNGNPNLKVSDKHT